MVVVATYPLRVQVSNRLVALVLCAVALSGCDLLVTRVSPSSAPPFGTFEAIGTVAPGGTVTGPAGPLKSTDIFGGTPSPSPSLTTVASPTPSATPPPTFTEKVPPTVAVPSVTLPTFQPVITPTPSPTASPTLAVPVITGFTPEFGARGSQVTISGLNLRSTRLVLFGDVSASPLGTPTDAQVVVLVPAGATTSKISLLTANGIVTSTRFFEVLEPTAPPTPCPIRTQCPSPTP